MTVENLVDMCAAFLANDKHCKQSSLTILLHTDTHTHQKTTSGDQQCIFTITAAGQRMMQASSNIKPFLAESLQSTCMVLVGNSVDCVILLV